jgi:hypothetical protein
MGKRFIGKGELGDGLDGQATSNVEVSYEPDDVVQVRVFGARDAETSIDDSCRGAREQCRGRLNWQDEDGADGWKQED